MTHHSGEAHAASTVDWDSLWTTKARLLRPARLASIVSRFSGVPGVVGMHGGLPPADAFPIESIHMGLGPMAGGGTLDIASPKDAAAAQQYCFAPQGYEPLRAKLQDLTTALQRPPRPVQVAVETRAHLEALRARSDAVCVANTGDGHLRLDLRLDMALDLLLERGDPLLLEEYTYSHALEAQLIPKGFELLPVPMDAEGMVPHALDALLASRRAAGLRMPRVIYLIPSGQNPTGAAMGPGRRAAIYEVCRRYDLVVVEDDAYSWLQYPGGEGAVPGLEGLQPGLLSLDVDGRVIRLDTFSKLLGPGLRLGWMTSPPAFAARAGLSISASTLGPASLSHVYMHRLLEHWRASDGLAGFVSALQRKYARAAALADAAAARHLSGLAAWRRPAGGMFMWLKLEGLEDSLELLEAGPAARVAVVPGSIFWVCAAAAAAANGGGAANGSGTANGYGAANGKAAAAGGGGGCGGGEAGQEPACPYFRVSFVSVPEEDLDEGFARLANAIRALKAKHAAAAATAAASAAAAASTTAAAAVAVAPGGPAVAPVARVTVAGVGGAPVAVGV